jgi:hypothetical protein
MGCGLFRAVSDNVRFGTFDHGMFELVIDRFVDVDALDVEADLKLYI